MGTSPNGKASCCARDRGEFISYPEWETEADIERYKNSAAHRQIISYTRGVKGAWSSCMIW
jgi:heme-degrading monooxygenase HmoA